MRVAVIGAGLQGVCIALELSMRGVAVDLYELEDAPLTRASLRNEGKIHLGFIFSNDRSLATARTMASGAFSFGPLLQRWLGAALPETLMACPFYYFVHRDSMLEPEELSRRYARIAALIAEQARTPGADYLGRADPMRAERLTARAQAGLVDDADIAATFQTSEIAVDPEKVAELLRARLVGEPMIRLHLCTKVLSAAATADCVTLTCVCAGEQQRMPYEHVINASWEGRLAIDLASGIDLPKQWCFREKYLLRLRTPTRANNIPSASIVLGPFGDLVQFAGGDLLLSWYPICRTALSREIAPPRCPSSLPESRAPEIRQRTYDGLRQLVPALRGLDAGAVARAEVHGGSIYALGHTDITDSNSGLHQRWDVGPRSVGRYHTIDTGKYSLAPMFAKRIVDRIFGVI